MNTRLIGELIKLRYKLMWAKTRTRNGKIALFFAGYILVVFFGLLLSLGGIGAGVIAVRAGKGLLLAASVLGGLYFQALLATVLIGFGMNAVFADTELRRYPIRARERRLARHLIGIADPFWFLVIAMELGLVVGLYLVGPGSLLLGTLAVLLLFLSNYLLAHVLALLVERMMQRKGGAAILLAIVMCLGIMPALGLPLLKKHPEWLAPLAALAHYTPPYGAAEAMLQPGVAAFRGLALLATWLLGLSAALVYLENRPPRPRAVESAVLNWSDPFERAGRWFGPAYAPLVAQWLRFYSRSNRFRFAYPMAVPLAAFLALTQMRGAGPNGQFATLLSCFALTGFIGTGQFAVNQFGYTGTGFRRYLLLPGDPAAVLRAGSFTFLALSGALIPLAAIVMKFFAPIPVTVSMLAMMVGGAATALFFMHGLGLWSSVLGPRRGNFQSSFGNDLSLAANIVFIGGMILVLAVPRVLNKVWPVAVNPANWWIAWLLVPAALAFYRVSLSRTGALFRKRREQILAVMEGRS